MDDLSQLCCQNSHCPDFGRRDAANLTVTGRIGKSRQYRLLYCRTCRARFSERKGTPLYRAHLPEDKVTSILEHVHEGCGVLKTARLVKVHPDTVSRYGRVAGEHSRAAHDELVAHSPETREIQMDEKWGFVAKEKNCDDDDPEDRFRGDCWDHVAFDPLCGAPHNGRLLGRTPHNWLGHRRPGAPAGRLGGPGGTDGGIGPGAGHRHQGTSGRPDSGP